MMDTAVAEPLAETNPNRPTEPGYCANCGSAPCVSHRHDWSCTAVPAPWTERQAVFDFVTNRQEGAFPGLDGHELGMMVGRVYGPLIR